VAANNRVATPASPPWRPPPAAPEPEPGAPPLYRALPNSRYVYQRPSQPGTGDRREAQAAFAAGLKAHRERQLAAASRFYREAIQSDPSYFEAYYNLGLATYELRQLPQALSAYELALSINPTSSNARLNFALALIRADFIRDAAEELEKLLELQPQENAARLALANLYAQQLFDYRQARRHYREVIERQPNHPQADEIRAWLSAHP
jgi:tetratricopeptide (TPR) repeat protein